MDHPIHVPGYNGSDRKEQLEDIDKKQKKTVGEMDILKVQLELAREAGDADRIRAIEAQITTLQDTFAGQIHNRVEKETGGW